MALSVPDGLKGLRDRALLLLGFAGAFRRSELVALDVADLEETEDGYRITIRRSQNRPGRPGEPSSPSSAATPTLPGQGGQGLAGSRGDHRGTALPPRRQGRPLGCSAAHRQVGLQIVQAYASRLGLDPAAFGAHSLRAGFLTSAARRGASVFKMRDVSRHRSMDVLQAYVRDADLFRDHAGVGLL